MNSPFPRPYRAVIFAMKQNKFQILPLTKNIHKTLAALLLIYYSNTTRRVSFRIYSRKFIRIRKSIGYNDKVKCHRKYVKCEQNANTLSLFEKISYFSLSTIVSRTIAKYRYRPNSTIFHKYSHK